MMCDSVPCHGSQRYLIGGRQYLFGDLFNFVDVSSLVLVAITVARTLGQADSTSTSQVAAAGTLLLWLRVIQYLNGFEATAAYVRMTLEVMADMKVFLLIMAILVAGNACVLVLLYTDESLQDKFGNFGTAVFSATLMLFSGWDTDQLNKALSPTLATGHYIFYVIFVPLVMLNLLVHCPRSTTVCTRAGLRTFAHVYCTLLMIDRSDGWVIRESGERAQEYHAAAACRAIATLRGANERGRAERYRELSEVDLLVPLQRAQW
jgi:hypothetical protein